MRGVNKLFKKLRDTGTVNRRPGSGIPHSARTEENAKVLFRKFPQSATDFCRLSGELAENTFLSIKKTKSVAYCGNFWSRSLRALCEQCSSRQSPPVHGASWNISEVLTNNLGHRRPM